MHDRPRLSLPAALAAGLLPAVTLAGCSAGPVLPAAPGARDPACTALVARLPATVLGRPRRATADPGTGLWGTPDPIVLRCGLDRPLAAADPCQMIDDVDWQYATTRSGLRFVAYGRTPVVEVLFPPSADPSSAPSALVDLNPAVRPLPARRHCR